MGLPTRRSARWSRSAPDATQPAPLAVEPLEEICLLSAAPTSADYEAWRNMQFQVAEATGGAAAGLGFSIDTQQLSGNDIAAQSDSRARQQIGADLVRQNYGYTGAGYTIAILDTGIDYTHPALATNYVGGWDFVDDDADPRDLNGHGTHVAGIIGSTDPTYLGIAPGVKIIALRVLDAGGSGTFGDVESALQWVAANRAQYNIVAVNMSLGAGNYASLPFNFLEDEFTTLKNQGVFIAAASGNSFYTNNSQQGLGYPAISNNTVAVGAVWSGNFGSVSWASGGRDYSTAVDRVTSFTQRSTGLDILAPGAMITSTYLNGGWASMAGTSMATPVVAAASVIIRQALDATGRTSQANQTGILQIMQMSGVTVVDGDDENDNVVNTGLSFKRLNLVGAIQAIASSPVNNNPTPNTGDQNFVKALYRDVLGREADSGGLTHWTQQLQAGVARATVAGAIWNSTEHRADQVRSMYSTYLQRSASTVEVNAWVAQLQAGVREIDVMRTFIMSPEYNARFASNSSFVQSLYTKVLGRAADSGGLAYWNQVLATGISRAQVTEAFFGSTEFLGREVDRAFQTWLHRAADPGSRQAWVNALRSGTSLANLNVLVLASDEYRGMAQAASGSGAAGALGAAASLTADETSPELSQALLSVSIDAVTPPSATMLDEQPRLSPEAHAELEAALVSALAALTDEIEALTDELAQAEDDLRRSLASGRQAVALDAVDDCYQLTDVLDEEPAGVLGAKLN